MSSAMQVRAGVLVAAAGLAGVMGAVGAAYGQCVPEVEPNDGKSSANPVLLASGECIHGNTLGQSGTGAGSADWWRVQTAGAAPGIYRHRMVLESEVVGHGPGLWGTTHTAAAVLGPWQGVVGTPTTSQVILQDNFVEGTERVCLWYGFGRGEQVYYRVTGTSTTTSDYIATLQTEEVTPALAGTFQAGWLTITTAGQGHSSDTDLWVFDANFQPIRGYGNDGATPFGGYGGAATNTASFLRREFDGGTYYLALTQSDLCLREGSPSDDNVQNGRCPDFVDVVASRSSATGATNMSFAVTDSVGTVQVPASTGGPKGVAWFRLDVVGSIPTGACCLPDGSCANLTPGGCEVQGGYFSAGACDGGTCLPGACCFASGGCSVYDPVACHNLGGTFQGSGTTCAATCAPPGNMLLPPNISAVGAAGPVFAPDYTQTLSVPGSATSFRLAVDALPRTGTGTNPSMEMTLTSPNGTVRVFGGSAALWDQALVSGTRASGGLSATSFDGVFAHNFGPITGDWRVNFRNTLSSSSTLNWTNIRITPIGPLCGPADFNGDGDVGTDQDIEAFFACLGGNCCPACWSGGADFNGDGDVGTDQDIEAYFRVLGGGSC